MVVRFHLDVGVAVVVVIASGGRQLLAGAPAGRFLVTQATVVARHVAHEVTGQGVVGQFERARDAPEPRRTATALGGSETLTPILEGLDLAITVAVIVTLDGLGVAAKQLDVVGQVSDGAGH